MLSGLLTFLGMMILKVTLALQLLLQTDSSANAGSARHSDKSATTASSRGTRLILFACGVLRLLAITLMYACDTDSRRKPPILSGKSAPGIADCK